MKWSFKVGRFAGIDVFLHFTFVLLLAWVALLHWRQEQSVAAAAAGVLFILAIFLCVALHEFGHALMARRYGIKTRDIILLPIGGVARLEKMPSKPSQELWVALAGPAVNAVIAGALFLWLMLTASLEPLRNLTVTAGSFVERIMAVNLFMIAFNLIPAFPMDGGRVLRALLATRVEYGRATQMAASIGQGIAVLFAVIGLLYNPFLLFIALFVWIGAAQEAGLARLSSSVGGVPVRRAMASDFRALDLNDSLHRAVELTLSGSQKDFPVFSNGRVAGILTQADLIKALREADRHRSLATVVRKNVTTVEDRDMLDSALAKFQECECHTLLVTKEGVIVGLLTTDNIQEYTRIRAAMHN